MAFLFIANKQHFLHNILTPTFIYVTASGVNGENKTSNPSQDMARGIVQNGDVIVEIQNATDTKKGMGNLENTLFRFKLIIFYHTTQNCQSNFLIRKLIMYDTFTIEF